jgi:hypothetical protein
MARLTKVQSQGGHRLYLEFSDGLSGEVDLSERLFGPVFEPLRDESFFARVYLDEFGAPCWPNGADLAPDGLYERVRQARPINVPAPS